MKRDKYEVINKKKNTFKKFLIRYCILLTILMVIFLIYVIHSLRVYENLQVDNFLNNTVQKIADEGIKGKKIKGIDLSKIRLSKFEKENVSKEKLLGNLLKNSKLTFKVNNESIDLTNPIYNVYADGEMVLKVKLNGEKKVTKLGILTFQDWKLDSVQLAKTNGIYECNIEIPSNLKAYVNGIEVTETEKSEGELDEGLKEISNYVDIPYMIKYKIEGLISEPEVKIEDKDGKEVEYKKDKNTFKVVVEAEKIEDKDEALEKIKGKVDIERIAKDWSLYLTNDLSGTLNGFYNISKYLIKDSGMWNYAYKWARSEDITFVSKHRLDNPTFTNVKLNNFTIYNDEAFSCEIYLQKNFTLTSFNKKHIEDIMNERMYFVYYDGEWKLVNMQSITNNDKK